MVGVELCASVTWTVSEVLPRETAFRRPVRADNAARVKAIKTPSRDQRTCLCNAQLRRTLVTFVTFSLDHRRACWESRLARNAYEAVCAWSITSTQ